jgi:threonylcarbamoyladenosine tRNA methylthiotransferase MtaB
MRRRYNLENFGNLIQKINEKIEDAGIGIDVIVGFPGEKEKHFENTFNFINSLNVSYLHVFNYSERRNTEAVEMDGKVDVKDRKLRSQVLRNLSNKKKFEFYLKYIDKKFDVLFESPKNGYIEGWTSNYMRVKVKYREEFENSILPVRLNEINGVKYISGTVEK